MNIDEALNRGAGSRFFSFIKKALLYFGRSILLVLGIAHIVLVFWEAFEDSPSFLEISTLEMVFFVVLFYMTKNHYDKSILSKRNWKLMVYLPLRNLGLPLAILLAVILADSPELSESNNADLAYDNSFQLVEYFIVLFCIYLATPKGTSSEQLENSKPNSEVPES